MYIYVFDHPIETEIAPHAHSVHQLIDLNVVQVFQTQDTWWTLHSIWKFHRMSFDECVAINYGLPEMAQRPTEP